MTILSPEEIGVLIYVVGGWGPGKPYSGATAESKAAVVKFLDTAVAVAYGESGWNTQAKNSGSTASGLFQIMASVHAAKISQSINRWSREDGKPASEYSVFDPRVNIDVARMVAQEAAKSGRDQWAPWQAYTTKSSGFKSGSGHGERVYKYLSDPDKIAKVYDDLMSKKIVPGNPNNLLDTVGSLPGAAVDKITGAAEAVNPANAIQGAVSTVLNAVKQIGITLAAFWVSMILVGLGIWFVISQTKAGKDLKSTATAVATKGVVK